MIKNRFFSKNHCRNCLSVFCVGTTVLLFASYFVSCGFASSVGSDYYLDNANNETGVEDFINPDEADESGDKFEEIIDNPFVKTAEENISTFSLDADSAAYSYMRTMLKSGRLPDKNSVRILYF